MTASNNSPESAEVPASDLPDETPSLYADETIKSLIESMAAVEAEKAELKDRLLRALADVENIRRRSERDVADARVYGITAFAKDMLSVADNLRRALETVPADAVTDALRPLIDGLELTERDLLKNFERHGIRKVEPYGEKFDPNLHQAMFEAPNTELPNGHVMEVIQSGFALGDRILRPALVGVARGGSKTSAPDEKAA
jgi:molecular chaperone GrpE